MSNDNNQITLTPSDIIGVIQRQLRELDAYLAQAPMGVDVNLCREHLERTRAFLESFAEMQAAIIKAQETNGQPKKEMRN